jgi:hypothetical protein
MHKLVDKSDHPAADAKIVSAAKVMYSTAHCIYKEKKSSTFVKKSLLQHQLASLL